MYIYNNNMGLLTFTMTKKREDLLETLKNHSDYSELTKADLLEAGLEQLLYNIKQPTKEETAKFPDFLDEKAWKQYYAKDMTPQEFKELDYFINFLMNIHNSKFREDKWI